MVDVCSVPSIPQPLPDTPVNLVSTDEQIGPPVKCQLTSDKICEVQGTCVPISSNVQEMKVNSKLLGQFCISLILSKVYKHLYVGTFTYCNVQMITRLFQVHVFAYEM